MTTVVDRVVETAIVMPLDVGDQPQRVARAIQDAALQAIDPRVAQRMARIDSDFDRLASQWERERAIARAASPKKRRLSPGPDALAMLSAGFGAASAVGAGRVASRTPAGELSVVGPTVLAVTGVALVALVVGAVVARREGAASQARAVLLWLAALWTLVAAIGVVTRLAIEGVTAYGIAAAIVAAVTCAVSLVLVVSAQRGSGRPSADPRRSPRAGEREDNELLAASEAARDRANDELASLDDAAREAFDTACAAGVDAVVGRRVLSSGAVRRLRSPDWAAARYDIAE